jgi:hypothetical protein
MTVLLIKNRTPELEGLFYKRYFYFWLKGNDKFRFHLYNFEWERTCKIEEWSQEMEQMGEAEQYEQMYGEILHSQAQPGGQYADMQYGEKFDDMDYL